MRSRSSLLRQANRIIAIETPITPPWKLIPPSQTRKALKGSASVLANGCVEDHVAQPAADDDAQRNPQDKVVQSARG
jgi:hypothetical protein